VFTTSHLTHAPIEHSLRTHFSSVLDHTVFLSPGRSIGLRLIPAARDLLFAWEETAQQKLDEQKEKMRDSVRIALTHWARNAGEGTDYTDNLPGQCLHPVGHWFEIPNLLKNGTLARLLAARVASDEAVASRHARVADALSRSLAANLDREDAETFLSIHGVARER
jgi:hypothetical protein